MPKLTVLAFIPVYRRSSPSSTRYRNRGTSYWTSSTFKSTSPVSVPRFMLNRRTWIFALPELTRRQVASPVLLMPEAAADDQPGEGILDSPGTLSPPIPAGTPEERFDGDEGDQRG
jgi:hypothetical protein